MRVTFREATRADVPAILGLLRDDAIGAARETAPDTDYGAAFDRMADEGGNLLFVGERDGRIVATFQLTFISGLSLRAARRAQIESVRVASDLRSRGIGAALLAEAEALARAAGCTLMQFTTTSTRDRARSFYERHGYSTSHAGYKKTLAPE